MLIYKITNKITGKVYVGQTMQALHVRWYQHKYSAIVSKKNWPLQRSIRKHGEENFDIEILETCNSIEEMNLKECFYIESLNAMVPNGYNAQTGGKTPRASLETRQKISKANSGKGNGRFGKECSKETREKISKANKGKPGHPVSEDVKRIISAANKGKRYALGYRHTKDAKNRISESKNKVKVKVFCITNNTAYDSLTAASKALGIDRCRIKAVIRGKRNHVKGFVFKEM